VLWLKGGKLQDLDDTLVTWIGQVNVKNGTAIDEVIKEQEKILGQQMTVTDFLHKK
jgi:hypothetical protein